MSCWPNIPAASTASRVPLKSDIFGGSYEGIVHATRANSNTLTEGRNGKIQATYQWGRSTSIVHST